MRIIGVKPFTARSPESIEVALGEALAKKGLKLQKLLSLQPAELRRLQQSIGEHELNFPGNTLVVTRIFGSSHSGRFALFAAKTQRIKSP